MASDSEDDHRPPAFTTWTVVDKSFMIWQSPQPAWQILQSHLRAQWTVAAEAQYRATLQEQRDAERRLDSVIKAAEAYLLDPRHWDQESMAFPGRASFQGEALVPAVLFAGVAPSDRRVIHAALCRAMPQQEPEMVWHPDGALKVGLTIPKTLL